MTRSTKTLETDVRCGGSSLFFSFLNPFPGAENAVYVLFAFSDAVPKFSTSHVTVWFLQGGSQNSDDQMKGPTLLLLATTSAMWLTLLVLRDRLSPEFFVPSKKSDVLSHRLPRHVHKPSSLVDRYGSDVVPSRIFGIRRWHAPRGRVLVPYDQPKPQKVCTSTMQSLCQAQKYALATT